MYKEATPKDARYGTHPTLGVSVSSDGRVLLPRGWSWGHASGKKAYLYVSIGGRHHTVHSLVCETFIGPRPEGMDIDHVDRNPKNNDLDNLRYVSRSDNLRNCDRCDGVSTRFGAHSYDDPRTYNRLYMRAYRAKKKTSTTRIGQ